MNQTNIEKFEAMLKSVNRQGIDELIEFLRKSDFYTAPASTRFHSCHEGGLLEHSLNVAKCLLEKFDSPIWENALNGVEKESAIISALLHDICKTNYYIPEMKNKKVYSEHGKKSDANGRFDWQSVQGYGIKDECPYGHGEKSVMMVEEFIKLKPVEKFAIRWHMGFSEPKEIWNTMTLAIKKYPLVLAIQESDLEATYLIEKEE